MASYFCTAFHPAKAIAQHTSNVNVFILTRGSVYDVRRNCLTSTSALLLRLIGTSPSHDDTLRNSFAEVSDTHFTFHHSSFCVCITVNYESPLQLYRICLYILAFAFEAEAQMWRTRFFVFLERVAHKLRRQREVETLMWRLSAFSLLARGAKRFFRYAASHGAGSAVSEGKIMIIP